MGSIFTALEIALEKTLQELLKLQKEEMVKCSGRELALVRTKLEEACMWLASAESIKQEEDDERAKSFIVPPQNS